MLVSQYQKNQNKLSESKNNMNQQIKEHEINQKQGMLDLGPSQSEINEYMKKVFLQTFDSNSHIDRVRMNYIKLKNKKNINHSVIGISNSVKGINHSIKGINHSVNCINNSDKGITVKDLSQSKNQRSVLLNESVKNSTITDYLRQLQQDSRKTNLPSQIINNKTLCSLYQKLDLFETNLISEHQKEQKINNYKTTKKQQQQDTQKQQSKLTKDQLQWHREYKQALNKAKDKLDLKQMRFNQIKQKLTQNNRLQQLQRSNILTNQYVESLMNETQRNLLIKREKLNSLEQELMSIESKQMRNIELNQKVQELTQQIKELLCQIYRKQNLFC